MTKLESIFLMNVALYLQDYHDISTFIQINHKSQECILNIKRNPYFTATTDETSNYKILKAQWYFPSLETIQIRVKDWIFVRKFYEKIKRIELVYQFHETIDEIYQSSQLEQQYFFSRIVNYQGNVLHIKWKMEQLESITIFDPEEKQLKFLCDDNKRLLLPKLKQITLKLNVWNEDDPKYRYNSSTEYSSFLGYIRKLDNCGYNIILNYGDITLNSIEETNIKRIKNFVPSSVNHCFESFSPFFANKPKHLFVFLNKYQLTMYKNYISEHSVLFHSLYYPIHYVGNTNVNLSSFNALTSIKFITPVQLVTLDLPTQLKELSLPEQMITPHIPNLPLMTSLKRLHLGLIKVNIVFPEQLEELYISSCEISLHCPQQLKTLSIRSVTKDINYNSQLRSLYLKNIVSPLKFPTTLKELSLKSIDKFDQIKTISSLTSLSIQMNKIVIKGNYFQQPTSRHIIECRIPPNLKELTVETSSLLMDSAPSNVTSLKVIFHINSMNVNKLNDIFSIAPQIPHVNVLFVFDKQLLFNEKKVEIKQQAEYSILNIYKKIGFCCIDDEIPCQKEIIIVD